MVVKGTGQLANDATTAMNSAPAIDAMVPANVIPPEVPGGTRLQDTIDIGPPPAKVPTSVAQVSAHDAARAPPPMANQIGEGKRIWQRAALA
jgi:hypothetical protein